MKKLLLELSKGLGQECSAKTFYEYAETRFGDYIRTLEQNEACVSDLLRKVQKDELRKDGTILSFVNLIKTIEKHCLEIMQKSYAGEILSATNMLLKLLRVQKYANYKLADMYANYLKLEVPDIEWYRCVDFDNAETSVNCNHVPFELRSKLKTGRFNQIGFPCLYLASSLETANKEVGMCEKGKKRYYGKFRSKKNLVSLDFSIPTEKRIDKMSEYDQFSFLITYPVRILCSTKAKDSNANFVEEYIFSQLLLHVLLLSKKDSKKDDDLPKFDGICYTSTKDNKGLNLVVPAKYFVKEPPAEGWSEFVDSLFEIDDPILYDSNLL